MFYYYKQSFQKMFDFYGRSRRAEYWICQLIDLCIVFAFFVFGGLIFQLLYYLEVVQQRDTKVLSILLMSLWGVTFFIWGITRLIARVALKIRRLHDVGHSGWFVLLDLSGIGSLVLLIFTLQEGQKGKNQYGADPKAGKRR